MTLRIFSCVGFVLLFACKPAISEPAVQEQQGCPAQGTCSIQVLSATAMAVHSDTNGKPFPVMVADSSQNVIKIEYINPGPKGVQDGMYREEILFQVPAGTGDLKITGKHIRGAKMLFGVFCYCKDKAGYYQVDAAEITRKNNLYSVVIPELVALQKLRNVSLAPTQ